MSWHFSLGLVEEFSALNCLDGESCARLKSIRTAEKSCFGDRKRESLKPSLSGTMCEPSMASLGVGRWMSSLLDSHVSPGPQLVGRGGEQRIQETSGLIPFALLEKSGHDIASWKTCQVCLLTNTLEPYSETWPRAGTMLGGKLYRQPKLEPPISEIGSGLWPTITVAEVTGGPVCLNAKHPYSMKLGQAVRMWSTPQSRDYKDRGNFTVHQEKSKLAHRAGGQLNPNWVEWLMGLPIGWTGLKPLVKAKFQQWLESHGNC
ncbi:hypothetical protein ES703_04102 [subsurface metagenome]